MDICVSQIEIRTEGYRPGHPRLSDQHTVNQAHPLVPGLNIGSLAREIQIGAPGEKVWNILADIGSVQDYSPGVVKSFYTSDIRSGVGASRHCDLFPTGTVEERIVSWSDGEQYAIEIYDWAGVPYTGLATFTLKSGGEGTKVTQSMDYRSTNNLPGATAGRSMAELVAIVIEGNLFGLKHFTETGEVVNREVFKRIKQSRGA